jgi:Protein of unknown function (DUF3750)
MQGSMRSFGRAVRLTLLIVFALPVAAKALMWSLEERPRNWWEARWTSAGFLPLPANDPEPRIYVFAARTGGWRSIFAVHTWIVVKAAGAEAYTRYDVTGFGRRPIRVNGYVPDSYWIGNRPELVATVGGDRAATAIPKIEHAIMDYPFAGEGDYRMWPGPNSNTFVATVLRAVPDLAVAMPPEAIGKDFRADGAVFDLTESGTGIEMSLLGLLGLKLGWVEGIEVNVLTLVAGLDARRPALKVPAFGRIGFDLLQSPPAAASAPPRAPVPAP